MLKDIELLAQFYACIWAKPKEIKVFYKLDCEKQKKLWTTKLKHIRFSRTEICDVNGPKTFCVPKTYDSHNHYGNYGNDYEFIIGMTFSGYFTPEFFVEMVWNGSPIYRITDYFAAKDGFLFKRIWYNFYLSCASTLQCKITGFTGRITFLYANVVINKQLDQIVLLPISMTALSSKCWKYIVVKDIPPGMFTTVQLDEMWSYEYPYMNRPKNLALIHFNTSGYINQDNTHLFKGLNIIHIECFNYLLMAHAGMTIRYYD